MHPLLLWECLPAHPPPPTLHRPARIHHFPRQDGGAGSLSWDASTLLPLLTATQQPSSQAAGQRGALDTWGPPAGKLPPLTPGVPTAPNTPYLAAPQSLLFKPCTKQ